MWLGPWASRRPRQHGGGPAPATHGAAHARSPRAAVVLALALLLCLASLAVAAAQQADAAGAASAAAPATAAAAPPPAAAPPAAAPEPQAPATPPPSKHEHGGVWPPDARDAALYVLVGVVTLIAASGGVGGGPVLVPLYLLLGRFSNTAAVALSNISIFGASIANCIVVVPRRRHPIKDRPLVAWDLIALLQPPTSIGAIWSAYINKLLPVFIAQTLLALILTLLTWRISARAAFIYKRESLALAAAASAAASAAARGEGERGDSGGSGGGGEGAAGGGEGAAAAGGKARKMRRTWSGDKARPAAIRKAGARAAGREQAGKEQKRAAAPFGAANGAGGANGTLAANGARAANGAGSASGANGALPPASCCDTASYAATGDGPLFFEPSVLPTLEVDMAMAPGAGDEWPGGGGREGGRVAPSPASPGKAGKGVAGGGRRRAVSAPAPEAVPPTAAESRLAYAPPIERAEPDEAEPDVGEDVVNGLANGGGGGVGKGAGGKGGPSGDKGRAGRASTPAPALQLPPGKLAPEAAAATAGPALARVLAAESRQLPLKYIGGLLLMCATLLLASMFSKRQPCASPGFWGIQAAAVPVLIAVAAAARHDILRRARVKAAAQVDWTGEIRWTRVNTVLFPTISILAGVVAGVFGLGGGIVFTPLMLELGTHPQVTAATTQTMLFFTTGAASVVFAQMGDIPWETAGVVMSVAFVCTLAGQLIIDRAVRHAGRGSLVVIVLAAFFGLATVLSYYVAGRAIADFVAAPAVMLRPRSIC